jgi:Uma2 family endonuclease
MVASVPAQPAGEPVLRELPPPDRLADGNEPEARVVVGGVSWESYLAFDKRLGDDRAEPRLYYLEGELEIMTTSREHERIREWIGGLIEIYFDQAEIDRFLYGQATMRLPFQQAGAEPDKSWCIHQDKPVPDIVLEIALTSGGLPKLKVYEKFAVPEVWIWRKDRLHIFLLNAQGEYEEASGSRLLPKVDLSLLQRCVSMRAWSEARRTFRAGLSSK